MPASRNVKYALADWLGEVLKERAPHAEVKGVEAGELQRVTPLVYQLKIWEENGPPRYFNITVSEML
jgi:hypothetical protein